MLAYAQPHLRQVMDLSPFFELSGYSFQRLLAVVTVQRPMSDDLIWISHLHQGPASMPGLSSRLLPAPLALALPLTS